MSPSPRILVLMGVAGSGKSTIGRILAASLGWPYFEADDFHPPANKDKMSRGHPLDDANRAPWLASIRARIDDCRAAGQNAIFTCSALKQKYRDVLGTDAPDITLVYLQGEIATMLARVEQRQGHFMPAVMVQSQFDALEPPSGALTLDVKRPPEEIVQAILEYLHRTGG